MQKGKERKRETERVKKYGEKRKEYEKRQKKHQKEAAIQLN